VAVWINSHLEEQSSLPFGLPRGIFAVELRLSILPSTCDIGNGRQKTTVYGCSAYLGRNVFLPLINIL